MKIEEASKVLENYDCNKCERYIFCKECPLPEAKRMGERALEALSAMKDDVDIYISQVENDSNF